MGVEEIKTLIIKNGGPENTESATRLIYSLIKNEEISYESFNTIIEWIFK